MQVGQSFAAGSYQGFNPLEIKRNAINHIENIVQQVLEVSEREQTPTNIVAEKLALKMRNGYKTTPTVVI